MRILKFSKALADETRARLINVLLRHELNVGEVVQVMDMGQSRVSRHLKILAESGLVECRRDGLWAFYRAATEGDGHVFLSGLESLFDNEPVFERDLASAESVIRDRTAETREFFDAIAEEWRRLRDNVLGGLDLHAEIAKRLNGCGVVADLGCGPGEILKVLAGAAESVIGVDNSPRMLDLAAERFSSDRRVSLRIGELSHLPLRDGEADCAVMSLVLHHLSHPLSALQEAARIVSDNGSLIIAEFDSHENELLRSDYGDRLLGIGRNEMEQMLGKAGFRLDKVEEFSVNMGLTVILYRAVR